MGPVGSSASDVSRLFEEKSYVLEKVITQPVPVLLVRRQYAREHNAGRGEPWLDARAYNLFPPQTSPGKIEYSGSHLRITRPSIHLVVKYTPGAVKEGVEMKLYSWEEQREMYLSQLYIVPLDYDPDGSENHIAAEDPENHIVVGETIAAKVNRLLQSKPTIVYRSLLVAGKDSVANALTLLQNMALCELEGDSLSKMKNLLA